jgi:cholesterol transport system auxiliary component
MEQMTMRIQRLLAMMASVLVLSACAIGKPTPQATTYGLEPPPPALAAARQPQRLRMGKVRVAPAFAGKPLVFRLDDVRYAADFYNAFLAEPGDLMGVVMAEWLDRSGPFQSVAQPDTRTPADLVLEATVTELYGDFRSGRNPAAVMSIQFTLVDLRGVSTRVRLKQTIGRRIDLPEASPAALVRGYGQALGEILAELVAALPRVS